MINRSKARAILDNKIIDVYFKNSHSVGFLGISLPHINSHAPVVCNRDDNFLDFRAHIDSIKRIDLLAPSLRLIL